MRLLSEHGPQTEDRLLVELRSAGVELGAEPEVTLADLLESDDLPLVMPLMDERYAFLPALLAGRVFTHRITPAEVEYGLIPVGADLEPLSILTESDPYQQLTDGSPVSSVIPSFDADLLGERNIPLDAVDDDASLLLPEGRLAAVGLRAGDLAGFRVTAQGWELTRVPAEDVGDSSRAMKDLGPGIEAILAERSKEEPEPLDEVVWTVCAGVPDLFRTPLPPLGDLLDAAGLPYDGENVALPGFDFAAWHSSLRLDVIRRQHGLDDQKSVAVLRMVALYWQVAEIYDRAAAGFRSEDPAESDEAARTPEEIDEEPLTGVADRLSSAAPSDRPERALVRDSLAVFADPDVAEAVLVEALGAGREGAGALAVFAETLEPIAPRRARAALRWLGGKANERLGFVADAEAAFEAAQGLDPDWPPTLFELARYASDRGDAERGIALLHRAGARSDDGLLTLLENFRPPSRPKLRRNSPCWCGSGRKYKQCHLRREQLPLAERAAWLYQKSGMYLSDGPWRDAVLAAAEIRSRHSDVPDALYQATQDGLVTDVMLFEGGAFAEFLAERGDLLPGDERNLAEQWLLVERSLYEVEAVEAGVGFAVRDLRTGDRHDVREATASRQLTSGTLICARIVPAGDTVQIFGGMEAIGMADRDPLIALLDNDPDPLDLVTFLSRRFAPPQLQNTEGDPVVLCEATVRVTDPVMLSTALDRAYDRDDADPEAPQWFEHVTTHGMQRIRATLTLSGDDLHVDTNSEARLDRILDTLRSLEPALSIVAEQRRPAHEISEAMGRAGGRVPDSAGPSESLLDPQDPQVTAILDQLISQYEQSWLDESIPALAGQTPRQAAADPTRRPDLIRLLDSFPQDANNPGVMNPARLRAALDLP